MRYTETREEQIKRRIFEKLVKRIEELQQSSQPFCAELNPDVIVISGDRTVLFEPQNLRVVKWLHLQLGMENLKVREKIHVHPARCQVINEALRAAGFEVSGWDIKPEIAGE